MNRRIPKTVKHGALIVVGLLAVSPAHADWHAVYLHPGPPHVGSGAYASGGGWQGGIATAPRPPFGLTTDHPVLWSGSAGTMIDILPISGNWDGGSVKGMSVNRQVGFVGGSNGVHAAMWRGTRESFVSLDFTGGDYIGSNALAVGGDQVVGTSYYARGRGARHAILWNAISFGWTDLNPPSSQISAAGATDGQTQGGYVIPIGEGQEHAALWRGTATSFVDLHPAGWRYSSVSGVGIGVQVGTASGLSGSARPALWHDTAQSFIDMTPGRGTFGHILATTGTVHVGEVMIDGVSSAGLWWGDSPDAFVNLHNFLAPEWWQSTATGISLHNGKYYISGRGGRTDFVRNQALLWVIDDVPTPASTSILALAGVLARRRRGR